MTTEAAPSRPPALPLAVAAVLVVAEAAALSAIGISVLSSASRTRAVLDLTTSLFFIGYAAVLVTCARGLWLARPWARGPVVFSQLVQLGVAWSFWSGSTTAVAMALLTVALAVLALVLAPASTDALRSGRDEA